MIIPVKTQLGGYDIVLERGSLEKANEYFNLNRKVLIVTDSGVPEEYSKKVALQCKEAKIFTFTQSEASKNIDTYKLILQSLIDGGFTRSDCVVAVGGGVAGDMAGFAAATFMRGIDFFNIPTTVLSQVDSSIGGKTAIDMGGVKNIVGAFWQPKGVIIDSNTLKTLPPRQISNGLSEAVKMSLTHDSQLFALFEGGNAVENIDTVIERSLMIKRSVVEQDENETSLRKVLNFGHTVGHAIESNSPHLYHGECVALGMLYMCSGEVRKRLIKVLEGLSLPTKIDINAEKLIETMIHDKKMAGETISFVTVTEIGSFNIEKESFQQFAERIKACNL